MNNTALRAGAQSANNIAMDRQAGGMPASACELVELEREKDVIIDFLV